jgi:hypothetical protein
MRDSWATCAHSFSLDIPLRSVLLRPRFAEQALAEATRPYHLRNDWIMGVERRSKNLVKKAFKNTCFQRLFRVVGSRSRNSSFANGLCRISQTRAMKKKKTFGQTIGSFLETKPLTALTSRAPSNLCLLCKINYATKTGSHLISRFLTKKFFSASQDSAQRTVVSRPKSLYGVLPLIKKLDKIVNSTGKEDYILCPSCENKIELVETEVARTFYYKFRNIRYKNEFSRDITSENYQGNNILYAENISAHLITLFVYSLFWRVSISSLIPNSADLTIEMEETLRLFLNDNLGDIADVKNKTSIKAPVKFQIIANSTDVPNKSTRRIYQIFNEDESILYIDNICFIIGNKMRGASKYFNAGDGICKIKICSDEAWMDLMQTVKEDVDDSNKKLEELVRKARF